MQIIENSEEHVTDAVDFRAGSGDQTDVIVIPSACKKQKTTP